VKMGPGNNGPEPPANILRAIRHGVAAGACRVAARADSARRGLWEAQAKTQRFYVIDLLHQAASADLNTCPAARTSRVMPSARSFEQAAMATQYSEGIDSRSPRRARVWHRHHLREDEAHEREQQRHPSGKSPKRVSSAGCYKL